MPSFTVDLPFLHCLPCHDDQHRRKSYANVYLDINQIQFDNYNCPELYRFVRDRQFTDKYSTHYDNAYINDDNHIILQDRDGYNYGILYLFNATTDNDDPIEIRFEWRMAAWEPNTWCP